MYLNYLYIKETIKHYKKYSTKDILHCMFSNRLCILRSKKAALSTSDKRSSFFASIYFITLFN